MFKIYFFLNKPIKNLNIKNIDLVNILIKDVNKKKINENIPEKIDHQNASAFPCLLLLSPNNFFLDII